MELLSGRSIIAKRGIAVVKDRGGMVNILSTDNGGDWTGDAAVIGGLQIYSADGSGPGVGLRGSILLEMTNVDGSGGAQWRFKTTDASGAVSSFIIGPDTITSFLQMVGKIWTVATLPPVDVAGSRGFVSDSNAALAAGHGNIVAGGGANFVPVYNDGTDWRIG
jgi:hypothetical protein